MSADLLRRLTTLRLAELDATRAKVEALERRADALAEAELARRRADLLDALRLRELAALAPRDGASHHVAELKSYLQSVYDADASGDVVLQQVASEHCIGYTVRLLGLLSGEPSRYSSKSVAGVLELATSTLAMFAARPSAHQALVDAGAVPVLVKVLSPLFATGTVINAAHAVGSLATSERARASLRASGGVGALVRLLRPDVASSVQAAAASALGRLGGQHDRTVQDSVRYLGGLAHLVDLLASHDAHLSEAARHALLAVRRSNIKNQAEIIALVRASTALVTNVRQLDAVAELLRFEHHESPALSATSYTTSTSLHAPAAAEVRALLDDLSDRSAYAPHTSIARPKSALSGKSSLSAAQPGSPRGGTGETWRLSTAPSAALVDIETELLRKKHLARFSQLELAVLLEEMGFDAIDLHALRTHGVDGSRVLVLSEEEMLLDLLLPRHKARKLKTLQRAASLFDRIASLPCQGKISETELRRFLAGQGATEGQVNKITRLVRTLVRSDRLDFISFWDFVTSADWVMQALRIYNIPV